MESLFDEIQKEENLIFGVLSSPFNPLTSSAKITIRPIKDELYQISRYTNTQVFHENVNSESLCQFIQREGSHYKQMVLFTSKADYHILKNKKGKNTIIKKAPTKKWELKPHNRKKKKILEEGLPIPFLIELEVMDKKGKVFPSMRDKWTQVNRFLELIQDTLNQLDRSLPLFIIDYGCGSSL